MGYGSKRVMAYVSDLTNNFSYGMKLSELIYEKNPQLGTTQTIKPTAGPIMGKPSNIRPRKAFFVNTAAKARRAYTVLTTAADIWTGASTTVGVPATDPENSDYDIEILAFTVTGWRGETAVGLVAGADTGMTQGDTDQT